jgi:glyoxylase-like metal-dependent hydrolase (beta-lactamase superfamily II)
MRVLLAFAGICLAILVGSAQVSDTLDIWVIDVEGGKAVIAKNPSGQVMMIDGGMPDMAGRGGAPGRGGAGGPGGAPTAPQGGGAVTPPPGGGAGMPPPAGGAGTPPQAGAPAGPPRAQMPPVEKDRDLNRVVAAAKLAGVSAFDVFLVTHYDVDHSGNVPNIAGRFPTKLFVDHGPWLENPNLGAMNKNAGDAYLAFVDGKPRQSVKPGDVIPFKDVKITVLTSNEEVNKKAFSGGGKPNAACPTELLPPTKGDDNASSIGTLWEFGKFRMADFADLLQWVEMKLMCPNNPIGTVDLLMGSHHGMPASSSPALVHALRAKAIVTNNGERKGIAPDVVKTLRATPGGMDIWQLHYSTMAGPELNAPEDFIANMKQQDCQGFAIKISARRDGSYTVTNLRNNFSKTYKP